MKMLKNRSAEKVSSSASKGKHFLHHELNLIGLKTRYCLRDKPEQCKKICSEKMIKFNRTYGSNLFTKLIHGKNTFRDFDHVIVPKYLNKFSLKELILREKNRMNQVNKLNSIIKSKMPSSEAKRFKRRLLLNSTLNQKEQTTKKEPSKNASMINHSDKKLIKTHKSHGSIRYYSNVCKSLKENAILFNKKEVFKSKAALLNITSGSEFFSKEDYVITRKGGVMNTSSLWRSKNINQMILSPKNTSYQEKVSFNYETNLIQSNAFITNFKVKNLISFIKNT